MLNCTDVLCILHEHHYYHHNHQHHLQDHRQHHDHDHDHEPSHDSSHDHPHTVTDSSDVSDVIHGLLNSTDSELSSLSHLDAPSDSVYMIFGVLIAMVLVALIIILLAVTISKLRKREEQHSTPSAAAPTDVVLHTTSAPAATTATPPSPAAVTSSGTTTQPPTAEQKEGGFLGLWQYPQQYVLYNANDKETLVTPVVLERSKFGRGIRKNLSGRWKRLTKKKPVNEVYTIPADLRDQLKSIYVY